MIIQAHILIPPGKMALWRNGNVVWVGDLGAPIEDVDCDKIQQVSPTDYERIRAATHLTPDRP